MLVCNRLVINELKSIFNVPIFALVALASIVISSCTVYNESAVGELSAGIDGFIAKDIPIHYQVEGTWKVANARKNDFEAMKKSCNFIKSETDFANFEKFVAEKAADEGIEKWNKAIMLMSNMRLNGKKCATAIFLFYSDNKAYIFARQPGRAPIERVAKGATIPAAVLMFDANISDGMHVAERSEPNEAYFSIHSGERNRSFGVMNFPDQAPTGELLTPGERAYCNLIGLVKNAIENEK